LVFVSQPLIGRPDTHVGNFVISKSLSQRCTRAIRPTPLVPFRDLYEPLLNEL
jgi:hypothetical protein